MQSASTTPPTDAAANQAAALAAYVERIEATAVVRRYVRLGSAEVDTFAAVVHYWTAAGQPAEAFELPLPRLRERLGNPSKNTVKAALAGLVGAHLLAWVQTSESRAEPTLVELGLVGAALDAKLAEVWGQNLTPNKNATTEARGQNLTPTVRARGQILTPKPGPLGSNSDTIAPSSGRFLTPTKSESSDNTPKSQTVTNSTNNNAEPQREKNADIVCNTVGSKEESLTTSKTKQPAKRRKKGDADFPPELVESFNRFWELYGIDGRKLDRADCLPVWAALTDADREAVFEVVEKYVAVNKARDNGQGVLTDFRPYPQKFLSKRRWEPFADALKARTNANQPTNQGAATNKPARRAGATNAVPAGITGYGLPGGLG